MRVTLRPISNMKISTLFGEIKPTEVNIIAWSHFKARGDGVVAICRPARRNSKILANERS